MHRDLGNFKCGLKILMTVITDVKKIKDFFSYLHQWRKQISSLNPPWNGNLEEYWNLGYMY